MSFSMRNVGSRLLPSILRGHKQYSVRRMPRRLSIQHLESRDVPAIFTVNALTDTGTADISDPNKGDLRYCITQANANPGADTINFDEATTAGQIISLATAMPSITDALTINGPALQNAPNTPTNPNVTIDGLGVFRFFTIADTNTTADNFVFTNLKLVNGSAASYGGAINLTSVNDNLTVTDCVISNSTSANFGGAIGAPTSTTQTKLGAVTLQRVIFSNNRNNANFGGAVCLDANTAPIPTIGWQVAITDCVFDGNSSSGNGGGLFVRVPNATMNVSRTTFSNNEVGNAGAGGFGGGVSILTSPGGDVKFANCTFSNNISTTVSGDPPSGGQGAAFSSGGGNNGNIYFQSCTISGNVNARGGAIAATSGSPSIFIQSSILFNNTNTAGAPDFTSGKVFASNSIISNTNGAGTYTDQGGNLIGVANDPLLTPLADNGGYTQTMIPGPFSPARENGTNPSGATLDQRGTGFPRLLGTKNDIGSIESQDPNPLASSSPSNVLTGGSTTYQFTVNFSDDNAINTSTIIGKNDVIQVTGPNGFTELAAYKSIDFSTNGTPRIATYEINAPFNGAAGFDKTDNGTYSISIIDGLVADTDSTVHTVKGGQIGSFSVGIPTTFNVTSELDDGGPNTLRTAILAANALTNSVDTINLAGVAGKTILLGTELLISDPLIVTSGSTNPSTVTISGQNATRVFNINGPGNISVSISGVTIANGNAADGGGMEIDSETVTLTNVAFTGNSSANTGGAIHLNVASAAVTATNTTFTNNSSASGGAIARFSNGPITIVDSTLTNNTATTGDGGAIRMDTGSLNIQNTLLAFNTASTLGGALSLSNAMTLVSIRNSTVSTNTAGGNGGGISTGQYAATLQILNSTVTNNTGAAGGGVFHSGTAGGGTVGGTEINSSIIAGNFGGSDLEAAGYTTTYTKSIIGALSGASVFVDGGSNLPIGTDPGIAPLASNGGNSLTHGLLPGSPAIDAGSNVAPTLTFDQRGTGFPRQVGTAVDIGAFEGVLPIPGGSMAAIATIVTPGATPNTVVVTYTGNTAIDVSTIGTSDIQILDPASNPLTITGVTVNTPTNGSPRVATYTFTPPVNTASGWDPSDNGSYTVKLLAGSIADTTSPTPLVNVAQTLGTFRVAIILVSNADDSGAGSLRQAITDANALAGNDVISFDPTFFTGSMKTITLQSAMPSILGGVVITGPGSSLATVDGAGAFVVIDTTIAAPSTPITISGLTIANGSTATSGGGISINDEAVTVQNCVIQNNIAAVNGAGINVDSAVGSLTIIGSTISGNTATLEGGAISTFQTSLSITGSTISNNTASGGVGGAINMNGASPNLTIATSTLSGNSASGNGGAVYFYNGGSVNMTRSTMSGNTTSGGLGGGGLYFWGTINANGFKVSNSTFSGNTATAGGGGAIFLSTLTGTAQILNSTIVGNSAVNGGGLGRDNGGSLTLVSTVVAGNSATGVAKDVNFGTAVVNATFSAVGSDGAGSLLNYASGNNIPLGTPLVLGPLANNGGPTFTHLPGATSPLLNSGSNSSPLSPDVDQIGNLRSAGQTDIGSVEIQPVFTGMTVNGGNAQRSRITTITVTFDIAVTAASFNTLGAITLTRTAVSSRPTGAIGDIVQTGPAANNHITVTQGSANSLILTFDNNGVTQNSNQSGVESGSLTDGYWRLAVNGVNVTGLNDLNLRRLYGDSTSSAGGTVNGSDLDVFGNAFSSNNIAFDFNNDGTINGADLDAFGNRFSNTL
ncbi:hypothetical protein BH11PLA2_BH11PLA2_28790 [soil metagenome]